MLIQKGTVLDSFELLQLLGKGGMGEVYQARDQRLNRIVAVKVLSRSVIEKPTVLARFKKEMQVLAKMSHPNIVKIYTYGNIEDVYYFVQEYVQGRDLQELLDDDGPFTPQEVFKLARCMADAFDHYHELGVIHRDLKPANIMKDQKDVYKIMDFGLVRDEEETRLTETGGIVGTLAYIPPDVLEGADPSPQMDVYQLGCILYELLTGKMILDDRDYLRVGFKKLKAKLIALPDLPENIDPRLDLVIRKSVHPDPEIRFSTGAELLAVLDDIVDVPIAETQPVRAARPPRRGRGVAAVKAPSTTFIGKLSQVLTKVNETSPAHKAAVGVVTLLFALMYLLFGAPLFYKEDASYFGSFRANPGPTSIQITWCAAENHGVKWSITGPDKVTRSGEVSAARRGHELVLPGLSPGTRYFLNLETSTGYRLKRNLLTNRIRLKGPVAITRTSQSNVRTLSMKFDLNYPAPVVVDLSGVKNTRLERPSSPTHLVNITLGLDIDTDTGLHGKISSGKEVLYDEDLPLGPRKLISAFRSDRIRQEQGQKFTDRYRTISDDSFPFRIVGGPVINGDRLFAADLNGFVYCLATNSKEGENPLKWALRLPDEGGLRRPRPWSLIARRQGNLVVTASDGKTIRSYLINSKQRENIWARKIKEVGSPSTLARSPSWTELSSSRQEWKHDIVTAPFANQYSAPYVATADERVLVVDVKEKNLHLLDPFRRRIAWTHKLGIEVTGTGQPAVDENTAYIIVRNRVGFDFIRAIKLSDGKVRWALKLAPAMRELRTTTPLPTDDGLVYALSGNNLFRLQKRRRKNLSFNLQVGREWSHRFSGFPTGKPVRFGDRLAFFFCVDSRVTSFGQKGIHLAVYMVSVKAGSKGVSDIRQLKLADYDIPVQMERDVLSPLFANGCLFFAYGDHMFGLSPWDWKLLYKDPIIGQAVNQPVKGSEALYFGTIGSHVYKLAIPRLPDRP